MKRPLAATVAIAFGLGFIANAREPASDAGRRARLVGCVVQTSDGVYQLSPTPRGTARATGSSSAKGSTPLGHGVAASDRARAGGVTTPKGSTPVHAVPVTDASPTTRGTNSPKSSTPVGHAGTPPYVLNAVDVDLTDHVGRLVEVVGGLRQRVLRLEVIRPLAGSCTP